jgi:hypothetical protein
MFLVSRLLLSGVLLLMAVTAKGGGDEPPEQVWSCLLYASDHGESSELPRRLLPFRKKLQRTLGLEKLRMLRQGQADMDTPGDHEISLEDNLRLSLKDFSRQSNGLYLLEVQVLRDNVPILEANTRISRGSPLFIRGLKSGLKGRDGQLVIAIELME